MEQVIAQRGERYTAWWDETAGTGTFEISGRWDDEDGQSFVAVASDLTERSRARHGQALIIFDLSKATLLNAGEVAGWKGISAYFTAQGDRLAVVVPSSLLKMQLKRMVNLAAQVDFFVSRHAAETWLVAHVQQASQSTEASLRVSV